MVLCKTNFISMSRWVDLNAAAGEQLATGLMPKDICYTYTSPIMESAYHLADTVIDYSNRPQDMLKLVEVLD
jgi:hypothetical protein